MRYTVRPISDRTAFTGAPKRSPFQSTWTATQRLLLTEVKHLAGRDLVIELDVTEGAIRKDGLLYVNARPTTPAVRIAFESVHGPLTYATNRFTTWQDNVRAIALGLEALRKVDRYGITKRGEQYAGWKALPGSTPMPPAEKPPMTAAEAVRTLAEITDDQPEHLNTFEALNHSWRRARRLTHPDHNHGDHAAAYRVDEAARVLGLIR